MVDRQTNEYTQRVREQTSQGTWEDIHTEAIPLDRKSQAEYLMQQLAIVAKRAKRTIHRRYLSWDPSSDSFLLRLGRSTQEYRIRAALLQQALGGDKGAGFEIRRIFRRAIKAPDADAM